FIIFMNPVLDYITSTCEGVQAGNRKVSIMTYVADLVLMAESKQAMENSYRKLKQFVRYNNFKINTEKSTYTTNRETSKTNPTCENKPIKWLVSNESYKYLSVGINLNLDWTNQIEDNEEKIKNTLTVITH